MSLEQYVIFFVKKAYLKLSKTSSGAFGGSLRVLLVFEVETENDILFFDFFFDFDFIRASWLSEYLGARFSSSTSI